MFAGAAKKVVDHRAVARVLIRGTLTDQELFEQALTAAEWPFFDKRGRQASYTEDTLAWYTVEVRFAGSRFRAVTGARERLQALVDGARLDGVVQAVDLVERDRPDLPQWSAYQAVSELPAGAGPLRRALRHCESWAVPLGLRDTGRQVHAARIGEARALGARRLPGAEPPGPAAWDMRSPQHGAARGAERPLSPARAVDRQMRLLQVPALFAYLCGVSVAVSRAAPGGGLVFEAALLVVLVPVAACIIRKMRRGSSMPGAVVTSSLAIGLFAAVGHSMVVAAPTSGDRAWMWAVGLAIAYVLFVGIWMLARQGSWSRVLPWLVPVLIPFTPVLLPGIGLLLPAYYLDNFNLDAEDVEIPLLFKFVAGIKLLWAMSPWLIVPALLGYVKHLHAWVRDAWMARAMGMFLSSAFLLIGLFSFGTGPAAEAGARTVRAAKTGGDPVPYYGIDPEWVCVRPVVDLDKLPSDGGIVDPGRAYLAIGDAGGTVALWDAAAGTAVKVPMGRLRIVPTDTPRAGCR
ncbi:hypothetical protein ACN20G_14350 [Streptomyces sp. BI20]|uniref:hypothetical protein n=1 Tax=Streptomyces sp. BI20 TaxID=3403460 RepID=UPI003C71CF7F